MDALQQAHDLKACEQAALRLIARAEQTVYGLIGKLEQKGHSPSCVRAVVSCLSEQGIVSDSRYTELWLNSRLALGGDSPRRLKAALYSKGIDHDVVKAALKANLHLEKEVFLIRRFLEKKRLCPESDEARHSLKQRLRTEEFSATALEVWEGERD
jgi:regulatory protein